MRRLHGIALLLSITLLSSCSPTSQVQATPAAGAGKPGVASKKILPVPGSDPNLALLARKFSTSDRTPISIVQLGDSHTAADLFTGEMRRLLQAQYGDGGIGFIAATPVPGTRYERVILNVAKRQWSQVSARNQQSTQFPLGGYLSLPQTPGAKVQIREREPSRQQYRVSALYQATTNSTLKAQSNLTQATRMLAATGGQWRFSPPFNNLSMPMELSVANNTGLALGGWNILAQKSAGVIYSSLGINGARLDVVDKWQPGWADALKALRPDMVILAYGTNEAFDDDLELDKYRAQLQDKITLLRKTLPKAVILLVGPPDSIKRRGAGSCAAAQPQPLRQLVRIQKDLAQRNRTLFWDWQAFMGGPCSISQWQANELARNDLVHLTADGYRKSADGLYRFLREQLGQPVP
ncbi:SGNH/GDSL hydrolase family protein [Pseudomonas sp. CF161]|uniref:SGNH/GDSL hydrolase family protein n=1 Tax=Pseudomonas sp. CF161 TaxID=911241 RepID=UPI000354FAB5|nr:SGNH/GDSL hydrolase family protein [Pseudomonas sp. CF161]EPL14785.1 putative lipoprotein [Pseudomonas sp. CF161]